MKVSMATIRKAFPAALCGAALVVSGCSDATTRENVSDARRGIA